MREKISFRGGRESVFVIVIHEQPLIGITTIRYLLTGTFSMLLLIPVTELATEQMIEIISLCLIIIIIMPCSLSLHFPATYTIHEEVAPRKPTSKPTLITPPPKVIALNTQRNEPPSTTTQRSVHNVIQAAHPQDNEIAGSVNIRQDQTPNVNVPFSVSNDQKEPHHSGGGARLNLGAVVALGAFGAFVFLAAVITTIVILVRR